MRRARNTRSAPFGGNRSVHLQSSTPEKIEHNIVWAKEFFVLLFGDASESLLYEEVDSVYMQHLHPSSPAVLQDPSSRMEFLLTLLEAIFDTEISKRLSIGSYATLAQSPIPVPVRRLAVFPAGISHLGHRRYSFRTLRHTCRQL